MHSSLRRVSRAFSIEGRRWRSPWSRASFLWGYIRDLYQHPKIPATVNFEHIKKHYYASHETINPTRIVPVGPELDFEAPHGREDM